jgi:phage terminase large subunit-like protein
LRAEFESLWKAGLLEEYLSSESLNAAIRLHRDFAFLAHPHQEHRAVGNGNVPWTTWLMLGGRGAGKTRAGAEWVRAMVFGAPPYATCRHRAIALIGETEHDVREIMVEGPSGLLQTAPRSERPVWTSTRRRLEWPNGAVGQIFSADEPESLRGPQFDAAWCDELAKWRYAEAAFDMLQFGLRLGSQPRQLITTTPRPIPLIKRLVADPRTLVSRAATAANKDFLAPTFLDAVVGRYAGTRLGRQELDGELIEDRVDALWSRTVIESCRVAAEPALVEIVIGIDPPGSARRGADACGIVAAGRSESGLIYVLEDASAAGLTPAGWAHKAVALYRRLNANRIVVEVNMGGDMVRQVLREVDRNVPLTEVHATRGKYLRAEPVAALYEQGKVKHVGAFSLLEDEMCDFAVDGLSSGRSPDRLDALVWAVTALNGRVHSGPRIRVWWDGPVVPRSIFGRWHNRN